MKNLISIEDQYGCKWLINPGYVAAVRESNHRPMPPDEDGKIPDWRPADIHLVSAAIVEVNEPIENVIDRLKGN